MILKIGESWYVYCGVANIDGLTAVSMCRINSMKSKVRETQDRFIVCGLYIPTITYTKMLAKNVSKLMKMYYHLHK